MERTGRRSLIGWAAALSASLCAGSYFPAWSHNGGNDDQEVREAIEQAERSAPRGKRPIVETHIHFWQVTRPGGVPYPGPENGSIFRDILPPEYESFARHNGIVTAGVV